MANTGLILATVGAILLLGLLGDLLARHLPLPRVTLLVLFGVAAGPSGFALLPVAAEDWYPLISTIALLMVGFLVGGKLSRAMLQTSGRQVLAISAFEVLGAALCVLGGLLLLGIDPALALIMAGIAPATAPAAIQTVVTEMRAQGRFADTLLGVVALDDAWGLIVFSILLALAQILAGNGGAAEALLHGGRELGGALLVGLLVGAPAAYLTGRLRPGEPTQAEALGVVLFAGGLSAWAGFSFLLTAIAVGAVIVNLASHHDRPFHEIENVEWPFMVLFFVLAGASLNLGALQTLGVLGAAYIALRALGLMLGAFVGGHVGRAPAPTRRWIGPALLPQAGIALGMALLAGNAFPDLRETILTLTIGSTVVFELAGPVLTRLALRRAYAPYTGAAPSHVQH